MEGCFMSVKRKICYILPKFDLETDTHYFYLYDFINKIAEELNLSLIIEKSKSDISFFKNINNIYVQKFSFKPLRILENFFFILLIRIKGYNNFYIHYSYISAFNSGVISRLTKAKTFYWNCGMNWLFGKDLSLKIILKLVNYLVTGVNSLKQGYIENYGIKEDKIKIMPNWIDLKRFKNIDTENIYNKYNLEKNKKYILFVHRLSKRKGAHYISKIAKYFKDQKDIVFLIAGDGPYKEKLEKEKLNNTALLGKVPNDYIPELMKISKVFFMPSEEEGFPRVLLESMASGLPYVAFDVGGVREISIRENQEFIYKIGDIDSMVAGISKLISNKSVYNNLKEFNLNYIRRFDIKEFKNKFIELIKVLNIQK